MLICSGFVAPLYKPRFQILYTFGFHFVNGGPLKFTNINDGFDKDAEKATPAPIVPKFQGTVVSSLSCYQLVVEQVNKQPRAHNLPWMLNTRALLNSFSLLWTHQLKRKNLWSLVSVWVIVFSVSHTFCVYRVESNVSVKVICWLIAEIILIVIVAVCNCMYCNCMRLFIRNFFKHILQTRFTTDNKTRVICLIFSCLNFFFLSLYSFLVSPPFLFPLCFSFLVFFCFSSCFLKLKTIRRYLYLHNTVQ